MFVQKAEHLTLTLILERKAAIKLNNKTIELIAPCILLSSWNDAIELIEGHQLVTKSLSFLPTLINKSFTSERLANNNFHEIADRHDYNLLKPFFTQHDGIIKPLPQIYLRISEWFDQASKEEKIKSSKTWLFHVRRYLMQILFSLESINPSDTLSDESITDIVLEHIHINYSREISLDSLCKLVYVNRTSLTRIFKTRTRRSPIDYLLHYRLSIACELLTNSKLSISKIAHACGFRYESYFIRQFKAKIGITPTQYRQGDGFEVLNIVKPSIVDEF